MGTTSPLALTCVIIITLEAIIGITITAFIIVLICFWYFRGQSISPSNKIVMALSISNIIFTVISFTNILILCFRPMAFLNTSNTPSIFSLSMFCITSSSWLTACLCFFYFMKIKNFSSQFLSRLKMNISTAVPWMILVAELVSLFTAAMNMLQFGQSEGYPSTNTSLLLSANMKSSSGTFPGNLYISFLGSFLPFLISVGTISSTVWSLKLHSRRMELNKGTTSGSRNINAYEGPIRIMIHLLFFYGMFYTILFLFYFNIFLSYSLGFWVFLIIMGSYGLNQSILLIFANPKLKEVLMNMLHCRNASAQEADDL
ncbi:taste receptor type 2 member 39-like [Pseudophryne corroboree]|uniref:taste receptor type 2 member 39-like n=1 Tax=Pseudophryne corroboree TaxID=495146 RepID=UPI00308142F8